MIPSYIDLFHLHSLAILDSLIELHIHRIILDIGSGYTKTNPVTSREQPGRWSGED